MKVGLILGVVVVVKAAIVVVFGQTTTPSSKTQDLHQKVSCWMNLAQSPSKLSTPLCEVEDYYNNDSSSPSLKQAFQLEIEVESSKTVIIATHDNRYKQLGRGDGCHKGHAGKTSQGM